MNAITEYRSRLPMPSDLDGLDARKWRVLCETTFPSARTPEAIVMALDYCRVRGLDVFKKPVHIVPMWNSTLGKEVETVWPGINEIQITAARTGDWAGMDMPVWGPEMTRTFKGRKMKKGTWEAAEATVTFPEWCAVTVYRLVNGNRCPFAEPVYWLEAYSRAGGANSELPTDMWVKRPRGQLHKVAKASSLRAAFPEEGDLTAEEMEGKEIEHGGVVIEHTALQPTAVSGGNGTKPAAPVEQSSASQREQMLRIIDAMTDEDKLYAWSERHAKAFNSLSEEDRKIVKQAAERKLTALRTAPIADGPEPGEVIDEPAPDLPHDEDGVVPSSFEEWFATLEKAYSSARNEAELKEIQKQRVKPYKHKLIPPDQDKVDALYVTHETRLGL